MLFHLSLYLSVFALKLHLGFLHFGEFGHFLLPMTHFTVWRNHTFRFVIPENDLIAFSSQVSCYLNINSSGEGIVLSLT